MVTGRQCFPESRSLITFARVKPDIAVYQLIVAAAHAGGGHFERSVLSGQCAPVRFSVTTPAMISPTPTTFVTDIGEPRNSTAISTIRAVPIADHSA